MQEKSNAIRRDGRPSGPGDRTDHHREILEATDASCSPRHINKTNK